MITVAGVAPSLDLTYQVETLRLGTIQRSSDVVLCAGGKPFNLARAAVAVGGSVSVVALLGGPTGALLEHELARSGVEVVVVPTPHDTRICVSIAAADSPGLTEVYQNAPPVPTAVWSELEVALTYALARRPGWLAINGGAPLGLPEQALADLVRLGHDHGARVAVDTYGPSLAAAVRARPAVVKVNRDEAAGLLGSAPEADLSAMAEELHERSGGFVVITDGVRGVVATDGTARWSARLPDVVGPFSVGSGDAFLAGLLTELDRGAGPEPALRSAVATGVANALRPGPGIIDLDDVDRLHGLVALNRIG